jgi:hypothetical protein
MLAAKFKATTLVTKIQFAAVAERHVETYIMELILSNLFFEGVQGFLIYQL